MLVKCEYCGKEFSRCEAHTNRAKHNFCSKECLFKSKLNKIEMIYDTVIIYAKNKEQEYKIFVDKDVYFEKIKPLNVTICISKTSQYRLPYPYFQIKGARKKMKLHRFIMNAKEGEVIDHINRNVLDNRLINLRKVDSIINLQNTQAQKNSSSGVKGVSWCESRKLWRGYVQINGHRQRVIETKYFNKCCKAVEEYRNEQLNKYLNSYYGKLP